MAKPIVLIIASNPLHNGPRMIREIEALKNEYDITAIGGTPPQDSSVKYVNIKKIYGLDRILKKLTWVAAKKEYIGKLYYTEFALHRIIKEIKPAFVITHNPIFLPYLFSFKGRDYKVIYNAHEYHPLEYEDRKGWLETFGKYYYQLYKQFLPKLDLLINVCESIAQKCLEEFGKPSIVIPNASVLYPSIVPTFAWEGETIRIIHHGGAIRERKIEIMIEAIRVLGSRFQLDLMLMPLNEEYFKELKDLADKAGNVNFIPPVNFKEIVPFISKYHVGLFHLCPSNFNYRVALPNKLFEFIQARLCVVVSPSPEMANIVNKFGVGLVAESFSEESLVSTIRRLDFIQINKFKEKCQSVAYEVAAEKYYAHLIKSIKKLQ